MYSILILLQLSVAITDDTVLLQLTPAQQQVHAESRAAEAVATSRLETALSSLSLARRTGDSRYASRAQALLQSQAADTAVQLLRADIAQYLHQFDVAADTLATVLQREPNNADAHLLAANLAFTQGDGATARRHCLALVGQRSHLLSHACVAYATSLRGQLSDSRRVLEQTLEHARSLNDSDANDTDVSETSWALQLLADMAERSFDDLAAERHYRAALLANPEAISALAALADLLLRQQRFAEVASLLAPFPDIDVLLLRWLHAMRLHGERQTETENALNERFSQLRQRGDRGHEREQALQSWWLLNEPQRALTYARQNFRKQRETLDIRLVAALAAATADQPAHTELQQWLDDSGYEDQVLESIAISGSVRLSKTAQTSVARTPVAWPSYCCWSGLAGDCLAVAAKPAAATCSTYLPPHLPPGQRQ